MPAHIVFYGSQIRGTHEEHLHQTKAIKLQENLQQQLKQWAWNKGGKVDKKHRNIPSTGNQAIQGQRGKADIKECLKTASSCKGDLVT